MLYRAHEAGCPHCEHHGYLGRLGLHELMLSNDTIRSQIRHRASGSELRQSALAAGMNGFIGKPVAEGELLRLLRPLVPGG